MDMHTMGRFARVAGLGALLTLAACSTTKVRSGYDPAVDFSTFRTFAFYENASIVDPGVRGFLERAVSRELESKGLRKVQGQGDLMVAMLGSVDRVEGLDAVTASQQGYSWGGGTVGYESLAMYGLASTTEVPVGTLVVDLVDGKRKAGVWRGAMQESLVVDPEETLKRLEAGVHKLFAKYPPR